MKSHSRNASLPLIVLLGIVPSSLFASADNPPRHPSAGVQPQPAPVTNTTPVPTGVGGLIGSTLAWQYYAYGGPYETGVGGSGTFVVNGGSGGQFQNYFKIVAGANTIDFVYDGATSTWSSSALSLAPTIYNGIAINMVSGPPFLAVVVDPATNMVGFNGSRISFTSNQIQVDWQNLAFAPGTIVRLDVITPNQQICRQDQFGNQYNFTIDQTLGYVFGSVTNAQGCSSPTWNLIGTFIETSSGFDLALTAANPTPTDTCVTMYTLSGTYPNFEWLYQNGYDNPQNSSYVACGSQITKGVVGKGALK